MSQRRKFLINYIDWRNKPEGLNNICNQSYLDIIFERFSIDIVNVAHFNQWPLCYIKILNIMLIQWLQQKLSCLFEADKKNNAAATFKVEVHHNTCPATFAILLFSDVSPSWVLRIGLSRTWNKPKIDIFNILNKAFLLFFRQIIWYIWWHFKVFIFEKSSNIHILPKPKIRVSGTDPICH